MDRVSERDRSSRKSRDERETDRNSSKDHHRDRDQDRDRDRDRDHKHRHRHSEKQEENRHGSRDEKLLDGDRHRRSRADSPKDEKHRDGDRHRRSRVDSPPDVEVDRFRGSVERPKDEKHRDGEGRHRLSRLDSSHDLEPGNGRSSGKYRDSVERDLEPRHGRSSDKHSRDSVERSSDGFRDSVERGKTSCEESIERNHHHHSSRKRKEHDGVEEETDKRGKRVRGSDGSRDERREKRRFADREEQTEEKISMVNKKGEQMDVEEDREKNRVEKEDFSYKEERKERRERRFSDRMMADENREKLEDNVKEDHLKSIGEPKPSVLLVVNGDLSNVTSNKSGSSYNVSQEPLTMTPKVSMVSAASCLPLPTKVSSITTTNENEGVNITRSDEVPGKSSTDGTTTTSVAGRSGSLTLDALAKAKKALQIQRELKEKLKKLPMLNKRPATGTDISSQATVNRDGVKVSTPVVASTSSATSENMSSTAGMGAVPGLAVPTNYEAVKRAQELAAKMGFRQDPEFAPLINMFPGPSGADVVASQKPTKVPVLRLDAQGREVDEHGNVVNMPKLTNLSTLKVNINKQKKEAFQILRPELDGDTKSNPHFDLDMGIDKTKLLRPKKMTFQFVEEGRWSKQAEIIKFKNQFGDAQAKELRVKQSQLAKAKGEVDNPNLIELPDRVDRAPRERKKEDIPQIEWWDKPLLPSGVYIDIGIEKLNLEKITIYVEHPRPIEPPAEPAPPPPQPLKLTKKEQKKLRTQRRLAKEKDRQEMIRQGLIEPPKSKVKMSNLMKVLGSEATQDPTRLEMEIRSAAAEREQAHVDRNIARKLTPAERREKKERKLFEDASTPETLVSVYKINDLSHPQTRFKVDVNAQENRLSGVAVISDGVTVVAVEGGKKSIKRYGKLMLKRINWAAAVGNGEVGDEKSDFPVNGCVLVWQGSVAKPSFHRFHVHQCRTEAAAKKVFADAGVPHYWDLAVNFSDDIM